MKYSLEGVQRVFKAQCPFNTAVVEELMRVVLASIILLLSAISFSLNVSDGVILTSSNMAKNTDSDFDTWVLSKTFTNHSDVVRSVSFSPTDSIAVSIGDDNTMSIINMSSLTIESQINPIATISPPSGDTGNYNFQRHYGEFSHDGELFAVHSSAQSANKITVYGTSNWSIIHHEVIESSYGVSCLSFSPDGDYLMAQSSEHEISLWSVESWTKFYTFNHGVGEALPELLDCDFSPDNSLLSYTSMHFDSVTFRNLVSQEMVKHFEYDYSKVSYSPVDDLVAITSEQNSTVHLYHLNNWTFFDSYSASSGPMSIDYSPDGAYIVLGLEDGSIEILNAKTMVNVEYIQASWSTLQTHTSPIRSIEYSQNGMLIISGSDDETMRIWDVDLDEDGVANLEDNDDDGDTWSDSDELGCFTNPLDNQSIPLDYDNDNICNIMDEEDLWIKIELKSWEADQSEYWDSDEGLPDPRFHVLVNVDGDEIGSFASQTWENTWTLEDAWNFTIDIDENTSYVDLEIQCRDNDAINDDECEMNGEDGEWKLYFQFDLSGPNTVDFSGDGTNDNDTSWREAASNWTVSLITFDEVDSDGDGVINLYDECEGFDDNEDADSDEIPDGCDDIVDSDADGVSDEDDQCEGYDDSDDFDDDGEPSGCDTDDDNDGTPDVDDGCPNTPLGAIVDWGCPMDSDEDGVYDGLDDCPNSVGHSGVDSNGCDLDSDSDGVPDFDDECANTPQGESLVEDFSYWGCSSSQIDSDSDGVNDHIDLCPNSVGYSGVDSNGCDLDSDFDGVPDFDDECANTPLGATVDYTGCHSDSDNDGVADGIDECDNSNLPVDDKGCFDAGSESSSDSTNSGSDSESLTSVVFVMIFIFGTILGLVYLFSRGKSSTSNLAQQQLSTNNSIQQQRMQSVVNQLDQERINAQQEANQLKKQLSDTESYSSAQLESMQSEMRRLQELMAESEQEKLEMQDQLEKSKSGTVIQNITYNIQDSAIAGDINTGLRDKDK